MISKHPQVEDLIEALKDRQPNALDGLLSACYSDLKRLASRRLSSDRDVTLDTTSLVHELYLKLCTRERLEIDNYAHFLSLCGRAMRQVLVDHLRNRAAIKRGGDTVIEDDVDPAETEQAGSDVEEAMMMAEALDRLQAIDPRLTRVLECRFFAGMTDEETARALDISVRTVQRDWARTRAWLGELSTDAR